MKYLKLFIVVIFLAFSEFAEAQPAELAVEPAPLQIRIPPPPPHPPLPFTRRHRRYRRHYRRRTTSRIHVNIPPPPPHPPLPMP